MSPVSDDTAQPVISRLENFDTSSGTVAERLIFNHRFWVLLVSLLATLVLGWQALNIQLAASFEKTIPTRHPYIVNFLEQREQLGGSGNALRIAVAAKKGTIFDKEYLETLLTSYLHGR